ncbi:MAG: VTT domain-containing protein [archaeon]|nr:VTT domain-containing protein [archaeon]
MINVPKYNPKLKKRIEIISILFAMAVIGFMVFSLINYNSLKVRVESEVQVSGFIGLFFAMFFLELIPQVMNPVLAVLAAITANMNVYFVLIFAVLGSLAGSLSGFWIGKKYGFKYIYALFEEKQVVRVHNFWDKYGKWFVLVSAVSPFPFIPLIFGALHMKWKNFIIYGLIPRIFNFVVPGYLFYLGLWGF